jgi:putative transposase
MGLAERKLAWDLEQRNVSLYEQQRWIKHYRKAFTLAGDLPCTPLHVALEDLDKAFQAFFRRVKAGEKAGYPRFKSYKRWDSFGLKEYGNGYKIDGRRLYVKGIGRLPVRWDRPYEGIIKTCRVSRRAGKWYASFACEVGQPVLLPHTGQAIGLDVGIASLLTSSDGWKVENPKWYRAGQAQLRRLQRVLARSKPRSRNRQRKLLAVQRQYEHVAAQRKDFLDKLIYDLIQQYDLIALEDLQIKNMVRNHHLSKSILDAGWGYFKQRLLDKAVDTGREVVLVDPAYTSKSCSACGAIFDGLTLSDRWVTCACGLSLDRDHNAAINILKRAGHVRES